MKASLTTLAVLLSCQFVNAQYATNAFNAGGGVSVPATFVSGALAGVTSNSATNTALGTQTGTLNSPCPTKSYCVPFPGPVLSGNTIAVKIFYGSGGTISSVTTDQSQTLTSAVTSSAESAKLGQAFYLCNATAGTRYITITQGTAAVIFDVFISQFAGPPSTGCLDTSASAVGAATTTPSGGSVTPTQTGDIIDATFIKAGTPACSTNPCYTAGTGQSGITWALRGVDYQNGGGEQWGVYSSTSALNPTITDISSTYIGLTLAFKAANGGTSPTGMYPIYQSRCNTPSTAGATQKCQFPSSGNLLTTQSVGGAPYITSVTDGTNSWKVPGGPSVYNNAGFQVPNSTLAYAGNATANGSGQLTFNLTNLFADCTIMMTDWVGAATTPFVSRQINGSQTTGAVSSQAVLSAFYPGITDGWVLTSGGVFTNTFVACAAPTGCLFSGTTWGGQSASGPSTPDQNNIWSYFHNSSGSSQAWTFGLFENDPLGGWAVEAASFLSATGALSGPSIVQAPITQATSGTTMTVTLTSTQASSVLVAMVGLQGGSRTVTKICTDGTTCAGGNSFTKATSGTAASVGNDTEAWYLTGHAAGVTAVEVTVSGTITSGEIKVFELRNVTTLDSGGTASLSTGAGVGGIYTGASVTPTGSPSIVMSIIAIDPATGVNWNPYDSNVFGYDNISYSDGDASGAAIAASGTYTYIVSASGATNAFCNSTIAFK
jgi:hypothetical protein